MKIYILGASGMLGSKLFTEFIKSPKHKIKGSVRKIPKKLKPFSKFIDKNTDVNNIVTVAYNLKKFKPDVVINCVGVIKQKILNKHDEKNTFYLNSIFPHELYKIVKSIKSRLIHFSTDCVFDGKLGNYNEKYPANSKDLYGFSKILGEVSYIGTLTLRTSIIGHELNSNLSLLEWFLSQNKSCKGYTKSFFSGLTTIEIYKILLKILLKKNLTGIYHLSSTKISKYELLKKISKIYKKKIVIIKSNKFKIDRSLNSTKLKKILKYKSPNWNNLILEMYKNHSNNI